MVKCIYNISNADYHRKSIQDTQKDINNLRE